MSRQDFAECINGHVANELLSDSERNRIIEMRDRLYEKFLPHHGEVSAAKKAADALAKIEANRIKKKKMNISRQASAIEESWSEVYSRFDEYKAAYDNLKAPVRLLVQKPSLNREMRRFMDKQVVTAQDAILKQIVDEMSTFVVAHRANMFNLWKMDDDQIKMVWRAAAGEKVSDDALQEMGEGVRKALDLAHKSYDSAGGIIGKLDNWMPQMHDANRIKSVGFKQWLDDVKGSLDYDNIINEETGVAFMSNKQFDDLGDVTDEMKKVLENVYKTLSTSGANKINKKAIRGKSRVGRGKSTATRRDHSRFLHFKNTDAQLKYNDKYGVGDSGLFDAVINHVTSMSRDIGLMRTMGPDAASTFSNWDMRFAGFDDQDMSGWTKGAFDVVSGKTLSQGKEGDFYRYSSGMQNILRSAYLGGASISAISDQAFMAVGAAMMGSNPFKAMRNYYRTGKGGDEVYIQMLKNQGHIVEVSSGQNMSFREDVNELGGAIDKSNKFQRKTGMMSSMVMEVSGLTAMTQRAKNVITGELHGNVAAHRSLGWDDLPAEMRESMRDVGMTSKHWDSIRKTNPFSPEESGGAMYIRPEDVAEIDVDAAFKYEQLSQLMRKLVTNEPSASVKALTTGAWLGPAAPGDPARAVSSWFWMFKSFPLSVVFNYVIPTYQRGMVKGQWGQFGAMMFTATAFGAAAIQAKETIKGRTLRDMDNAKFWAAAFVQGGAAGFFADFFFADQNRFGQSPLKAFLGPGFQLGEDVMYANLGPLWAGAIDSDTSFSDAFDDWTARNARLWPRLVPGSSLWPTRLAYERIVVDNINSFADPEYYSKLSRHKRQLMKDYGQEYRDFAEPGKYTFR